MLENEACSNKYFSGLPSCKSESIDESSSLESDVTKTSNHCFISNLQSTRREICDKSAKVSNSFDYQMDCISEADNDLSFLGNNQDGKLSNDLLHYSWSDIGNFDDVDRMFRSYDSTFGQGTSNEDNLGWFSLSNATGVWEETFKFNSKFSCPDSSSLSRQENEDMQSPSIMYRGSSRSSVRDEYGPFDAPSSNGSSYSGSKNNDNNFVPTALINERNMQSKNQNQSDISKTDQYLENSPIFYIGNDAESGHQQTEALDSQFFCYMQDDTPYMISDYNCQPEQPPLHLPLTAVKSENTSPTSLSLKDSYPLDQMQSTEGFEGSSLQLISSATDIQQRGFQASESMNPENVDLTVQASMGGRTTKKEVPYSGESHIDGEVNGGVSFDIGSSAQYSSTSSGLDDISIEATSFRQLQNAMERLDLRTKLCIRDSLYRLAQSAEQRNQYVNMNGVSTDDRDSMSADQGNKFTSFMDIETETNPIDRSIAHLLFHRPADSSVLAGHDSSFNSPPPIHGLSRNSPVVATGSVKREETAAESDRNVADN
ncbi:hypothetical protein Leryth_013435 [Lithospermum erythrorhizon]|nr:hypothetical protein Leryth_013435 [Lithospermum erythrorhizon]